MKEKDLEKNLDNLIIDGLINEAEQDNADFEVAMRNMSDEEFEELIYGYAYEDNHLHTGAISASYSISNLKEERERENSHKQPVVLFNKNQIFDFEHECRASLDYDTEELEAPKTSGWRVARPWIISAVAAVAVILIVLIPSMNMMNARLCESALYASESYITPTKGGFDISNASVADIKEELPNLELRYRECIHDDGRFILYSNNLQESGWDLTVAYLKLHKKGDAVNVLKVLAGQYGDTDFGRHCKALLDQLD